MLESSSSVRSHLNSVFPSTIVAVLKLNMPLHRFQPIRTEILNAEVQGRTFPNGSGG
jgi:hypothetical protein